MGGEIRKIYTVTLQVLPKRTSSSWKEKECRIQVSSNILTFRIAVRQHRPHKKISRIHILMTTTHLSIGGLVSRTFNGISGTPQLTHRHVENVEVKDIRRISAP